MKGLIIALAAVSFAAGCEPEPDGGAMPSGSLEYEHPSVSIYRLERRVEVILVESDGERRECGVLSERAHTELENTLDGLDRSRDYGYDRDTLDCMAPPGAMVYIEGFKYSPFSCEWYCCHPDLSHAALIYSLIESHFRGGMPTVEGEPYVAIERIEPCP